jgi:hypothetical protein
LVDQYLEAAADFCENELSPSTKSVTVKVVLGMMALLQHLQALKKRIKNISNLAFPSLSAEEQWRSRFTCSRDVISEMVGTANWAWGMYPGLSHGAVRTIEHHGSDEQKSTYLPNLVSGVWTGTMCLTESHAGSDLVLSALKLNQMQMVAMQSLARKSLSLLVNMTWLKTSFISFLLAYLVHLKAPKVFHYLSYQSSM